jgi:hypothetical protein
MASEVSTSITKLRKSSSGCSPSKPMIMRVKPCVRVQRMRRFRMVDMCKGKKSNDFNTLMMSSMLDSTWYGISKIRSQHHRILPRTSLNLHLTYHLRTRSVPVVDGWPLLSDEWLTTGVGLTLGLVRRCRLRPSSCCCRWRTGVKGLQPWGASGRWRDK